jgi:hypothetical protein
MMLLLPWPGLVDAALVLVHVHLSLALVGSDNGRQAVISAIFVPFNLVFEFVLDFFFYKSTCISGVV